MVTQIIRCNASIFSEPEFDLSQTSLVEHSVDTMEQRPVCQALRYHLVAYMGQWHHGANGGQQMDIKHCSCL